MPGFVLIVNPNDTEVEVKIEFEIRDRAYRRDNSLVIHRFDRIMWQDDADAIGPERDYNEAVAYCDSLTLGGYDDWRLPGISDMFLIEWSQTKLGIFSNILPTEKYWTIEQDSINGDGSGFGSPANSFSDNFVRCGRVSVSLLENRNQCRGVFQ